MENTREIWRGKGRKLRNAVEFIAPHDFYFGGKLIPVGSKVRQWEGPDFGYTYWIDPKDNKGHFAKY